MSRRRELLVIAVSFVAGVASALIFPSLVRGVAHKWIRADYHEDTRTTSPDGTVDAVTEVAECGVPCSSTYAVSLVPKGKAASTHPVRQVLIAEDMVNARTQWKGPHLLEVSYDRGLIESFRSLAYPFARSGDEDSWRYAVEVRLAPSSPRFSYLTDTGTQ